jgi:outer membrane protein OmpA-like peptidoglycan-associated protein
MICSASTRYRPLFMGILFLCCLFLSTHRVGAQDSENTSTWYKSIFIEAGGIMNLPPKLFLGDIKPMFGFHGALGYEWLKIEEGRAGNLRFSLSSGYSQASGADPLVESLSFIPITGRLGYALPIKNNWGAEVDLGFGVQLSKTLHYEIMLDYLAGRRSESQELKLLAEGRLHAMYTLPNNFLKFYAGGGADLIFETDSPIPVPVIEAGISIKPLALYSPKKPKAVIPVPKPEPEIVPEPEIESEKPARVEYEIYFRANSGTRVFEHSLPLLQEAGRLLQKDPEARVILRGFAAPFGTAESQVAISAARVWHCAEYLKEEFNIAEDRIHMLFFGSEETHDHRRTTEWPLRRRVELIIEFSPEEGKAETGIHGGSLVIEPKPRQDKPADYQYAIYFEADRGTRIVAQSLPLLQEAGRLLQTDPEARVILEGYAAPSGTTRGQAAISAARVWHCAEYLRREYNVAEERITMQFFGAQETFASGDPEWHLRRRVEVIINRRR